MSAHSSPASYSDSSSSPPLTSLTERHLITKGSSTGNKLRARMMRYRNKLKKMPEDEREEAPCSRPGGPCPLSRTQTVPPLLDAARCKRHAAYAEKFGQEALEAKLERKRQRELEQQERPRRRGPCEADEIGQNARGR
ncbi:hypothetical protein C8R47DRAFT_1216098 [Mycena vitilis]|nr:hypothetical protein C8R47DRAFT_1216098 [Mycena vitilis]